MHRDEKDSGEEEDVEKLPGNGQEETELTPDV